MDSENIIKITRRWVERFVIQLNLCPFVKRELINHRIRFVASEATTEEQLLIELQNELKILNDDLSIETTLLIHKNVLCNFYDYNEFLNIADSLLVEMEFEGVYQIASFHPDYQFDRTAPGDVENYTNRSPYPMLHLLRENSLERAIESYPDIDMIPKRNIELMNDLGQSKLNDLLLACHSK